MLKGSLDDQLTLRQEARKKLLEYLKDFKTFEMQQLPTEILEMLGEKPQDSWSIEDTLNGLLANSDGNDEDSEKKQIGTSPSNAGLSDANLY
jgi:hypothetical protein